MDDQTTREILSDLRRFTRHLFAGCGGRPMMANLELCVHAHLVQAKRKTHQPAGMHLARVPEEADALRQKMNRATLGRWSDEVVRERLHELAPRLVPGAFAWIVDDTTLEKKGTKSPGVARQYSGTTGKVSNCQTIVSTHLSGWTSSLPLEMDLYVPESWCDDPERCAAAGMPPELVFRTKIELALEQADRLLRGGVPKGLVLADQGYGKSGGYRQGLRERNLDYALGIPDTLSLWRPNEGPIPPKPPGGIGRPQSRWQIGAHKPVSAKTLAFELGDDAWETIVLETGRHAATETRFAALRVRTAHRAKSGKPPGEEEWLIVEWPQGEASPTHYYLSNLSSDTTLTRLAEVAKLRWRVERDYQDLKQEVGLAHYEGRRWVGLHHHLTTCMAAMAYLAGKRELFPPAAHGVTRLGPAPHSAAPR